MNKVSLLLLFQLILSYRAASQAISDQGSYRSMGSDQYARLYYENDFFGNTDYYYTQGIYFEFIHPALRNNPLNKLLIRPRHPSVLIYGLAAEHNAYTPTDYQSDNILYGDRPFAADMMLKTFITAIDSIRQSRFTTTISTGLIGPAAGGYEIQYAIHSRTANALPHGWQYQIQNDIILNYEVNYETSLINAGNHLLISAIGNLRAGTLSTRAAAGLTVMAGSFNSPFSIAKGPKPTLYLYAHPEIQAIAYDATLQGGLFNHRNPYTISAGDINRLVFTGQYGAVLTYKWLYIEYFQRYITREFITGKDHLTGGILIGIHI